MDRYVTGAMIKKLREERKMTQPELAAKLFVSEKTVSKWETGRGYPDIRTLEPLAAALGVSLVELMSGEDITNKNKHFNMLRTAVYICPVCGNILFGTGEAVICCCGVNLIPETPEQPDEAHALNVEYCDGEYYVTVDHEMTKEHSVSFIAALTDTGWMLVKQYPEGNAEAHFPLSGTRKFLWACNRHGMFAMNAPRPKRK
ncbi:MAG: helix-turn-helix domain-containing protein [Clostridia bacterium]|nr:helix-turn-helix domain-containing protein [Clostridia bacterium]